MRLSAATTAGLATFLWIVGLANAGVIKPADDQVTEVTSTKVHQPGWPYTGPMGPQGSCCKEGCTDCTWNNCFLNAPCVKDSEYTQCCFDMPVVSMTFSLTVEVSPTAAPEPKDTHKIETVASEDLPKSSLVISERGPLSYPHCCKPGCNLCSAQTCFSSNCERNVIYTSCCSDRFLLANAIFVDEIEETPQVPEQDAPTPTVQAESVEHEVRQVEGPNPTPWCCRPGCEVCSGYTCWAGHCPINFASCCADAFLLSTATFVDIGELTVPDVEISAPEGRSAAISARQLQISGHYGGGGFGYNSIMAPAADAIVTARQPQVSGHYGGGGVGDNSIEAANAVVTARQPQIGGIYGGPGVGGENSILAPNAAVTAR